MEPVAKAERYVVGMKVANEADDDGQRVRGDADVDVIHGPCS